MVSDFARQFCVKHAIAPCRIGVAVSGGVDSTALLLAMAELRRDGFEILAFHVNHHLRGAESDADESFVAELCAGLGVVLLRADAPLDPDAVRTAGVEAAAREARYRCLRAMKDEAGARWVATAHQKDDQAETVLMRLLGRGGIAGLRGIHPVRDDGFIRPLLDLDRASIEAWLRGRGITPRFDRSNDDPRFLRNRVRTMLRQFEGEDAVGALHRLAGEAQQIWPLLEELVDRAERECVEPVPGGVRFRSWPSDPWLRKALLHREIRALDAQARDVGADALERLAAECDSARRVSVTRNLELCGAADGTATLRRRAVRAEAFDLPLTESAPAVVPAAGVAVHLARVNPEPGLDPRRNGTRQLLQVPDDRGSFTVRNRRDGDRFQPLGLPRPKKLKELLIDRKIAAGERDRLPLVLWNGEIAWVAGVEVSERFKVTGPGGVLYEVWMEDAGAGFGADHPGVHG